MDYTKRLNFNNIFIFLFFVLFPFGQIIRIGILHPMDVIVGLTAFYAILKRFKKPDFFKYIEGLLAAATFSWIFGSLIFKQVEVLYGLMYLIRLFAYSYFFIYVCHFSTSNLKNGKLLLDSLLSISVMSAVFGWIQFFKFPDIKPFFTWGWDMHLFRLVGTFLDPTFLGLILVFGLLITIHRCIVNKKRWYYILALFLLISLAFTYSRASYIAFTVGVLVIIYLNRKLKKLLLLIAGLSVVVFFLPTTKNNSIRLFRSFSAIAKIENYQATLAIFAKSPVFGIGYNNMCFAYQKYIGPQMFTSHACSGSDSSLLFVLTTTGVVGLIVSIYLFLQIRNAILHTTYYILLFASFVALVVHSLFSNSFFYPWIMGWMVILLALCIKKKNLV